MAINNDNVYARVREKIKEHKLTEEEGNAIEKARSQLSVHARLGGFTGAALGFMLGRRKKFNPFQILALSAGGFFMGAQLGMVSGAMAGVRTIKALPNSQHLIGVISEVQNEMMATKGYRRDAATGRPRPMTEEEKQRVQDNQLNRSSPLYSVDEDGQHDTAGVLNDSRYRWSQQQQQQQQQREQQQEQDQQRNTLPAQDMGQDSDNEILMNDSSTTSSEKQYGSAWDRVREEHLPNTSWTKLRMQAQQQAHNKPDSRPSAWKRPSEDAPTDELPRTREETEQMSSGRRNQWGDPV